LESLQQLLALAVLVVLVSTLGVSQAFAEEKFESYENFLYGFSIDYPSDWLKIEPADPLVKVIFMSPLSGDDDASQENVLIMREETVVQLGSADYGKLVTDQMKSITPEFQLLESGTTFVAGNSYYKITYTAKDEIGGKFKQTIFFITSEKSAYAIGLTTSLTDYHDYFPTFEKMIESFTLRGGPGPKLVTGQYVNEDAGFHLTLPSQWQGFEIILDELTTTVITPQDMPSDTSEFAMMTVGSMTNEVASTSDFAFGDEETCSMPNSAVISKVFDMKALEFEMKCTMPGIDNMLDTINYGYITDDNTIFLSYGASSQTTFEKYLPSFEKTVQSLRIENNVDLSDASILAEVYDSHLTSKTVSQQDVDKKILILSKSPVSTFSFSDSSNLIIFKPQGAINSNTDYATVYINDVLSPPFKVSVNGVAVEDFMVVEDKTNGAVSIEFGYEFPVEKITIEGSEKENFPSDDKSKTTDDEKDPSSQLKIPDWVRGNAEWWAQGAIGDSDFVSGIQYLIKEGIMTIPETATPASGGDSKEIPSWIKNNADWWAQGLISDDDFVKGIQFLVENGIMEV
jgi:hypothetical protein